MFLCQYVMNGGTDLIENHRIRYSSFSNLNDPFDFFFLIASPNDEEVESIQNNTKQQDDYFRAHVNAGLYKENERGKCIELFKANKARMKTWLPEVLHQNQEKARKNMHNIKLICFSDVSELTEQEDILLWSHYTNKHKGFRVVFDFDSNTYEMLKVEYDGPLTFSVSDILINKELFIKKSMMALKKKASIWKYEHEMRMLVLKRPPTEEYAYFEPQQIKFVDLGLYCNPDTKDKLVSCLKRDEYKGVTLRQVKVRRDECTFEYEEVAR